MRRRPLLLPTILFLQILIIAPSLPSAFGTGTLFISPGQSTGGNQTVVTLAVKVANMDPFNASDIKVETDTTILNPLSLSVTGNLFAANYTVGLIELVNCVNNGAGITPGQPGNMNCVPGVDGPGIAHSATVAPTPAPTKSPISGLIFEITYKVVGVGSSAIHIPGDLIQDGALAVAHTTVDGQFDNTFQVHVTPSSVEAQPGSNILSLVQVTSFDSFSQRINLTLTNLPVGTRASLSLNSGIGNYTSILTLNLGPAATGSSYITIAGTSGSLQRTANLTLLGTPPDYTVTAQPYTIIINPGKSGNLTITLASVSGFNKTIILKIVGLPSAVTAGFYPDSGIPPFKSVLSLKVDSSASPEGVLVEVTSSSSTNERSGSFNLIIQSAGNASRSTPLLNAYDAILVGGVAAASVAALVVYWRRRERKLNPKRANPTPIERVNSLSLVAPSPVDYSNHSERQPGRQDSYEHQRPIVRRVRRSLNLER